MPREVRTPQRHADAAKARARRAVRQVTDRNTRGWLFELLTRGERAGVDTTPNSAKVGTVIRDN
jgi:hypothetical protein